MSLPDTQVLPVLVRDPGCLGYAGRYLHNRGVQLKLYSSVNSLLQAVGQNPPRFVLVSVDFNSSALSAATRILTTLYRCRLIYFCETDSMPAYMALKSQTEGHKIFGLPSGPAIERTLNAMGARVPETAREPAPETPDPQAFEPDETTRTWSSFRDRLNEVLDGRLGTAKGEVKTVRQVECMKVYMKDCSETFFIGLPENCENRDEIARTLREALLESFAAEGRTIEDHSSFSVPTQSLDFKLWIREEGRQSLEMSHRGYEVVVASFDWDQIPPDEKETFDPDMYRIPASALEASEMLEFDLFVYFPLSRKFVLLVPRQSKLTAGTFAALKRNLVKALHVFREDRHKMRQFLMRKELRRRAVHYQIHSQSA